MSIPLRWAAIGIVFAASAYAQPADIESAVLQADAAYRNAVVRADIAGLKALLRQDVIIIHSDGTMDNRANFLNAISSGRLMLQSYERSNVFVRIYGSTALLVSRAAKRFTYKGSPATDDDTSLVTYVRDGARWRIAAMQNTHWPQSK